MNGFALDSNIISFYVKEREIIVQKIRQELQVKTTILIPPFAYYEVKRGLIAVNATGLHLADWS